MAAACTFGGAAGSPRKNSTTALDRWSSTTRWGYRRSRQEGEEQGTYDALRGHSAPLQGTRPAPLPEVAGPQGRPVVPFSLGAGVRDGVDSSTLVFLAARAVQAREEEEEAEELRQVDEVLPGRGPVGGGTRVGQPSLQWSKPLVTGRRLGSEERRGKGGRRGGGPGGRGSHRLRFPLRLFALDWLRFPGEHSGGVCVVQRLLSSW